MSDFVFTSPGVKFKEKDLTFVTRQVGTTFLGLVGETEKGPAFEPVKIEDKAQFRKRLGNQSLNRFQNGELQYQLPYVANAFLEESNELYVTRVLGLSGYESGDSWAITLDAGIDYDNQISATTETFSDTFENNEYSTITITHKNQKISFTKNFEKSGDIFTWDKYDLTATEYDSETRMGEVSGNIITYKYGSLLEYENMTLAVLRSRAEVFDNINEPPETKHWVTDVSISGNTTNIHDGNLFGDFVLKVTYLDHDNNTQYDKYRISLDPDSPNFISRVLGVDGKDKDKKIFVEATYPDLIRKLDNDELGFAVNDDLVHIPKNDKNRFYDYYTKEQYKTPITPWVVSQVKGDSVDKLFKFISISDGNSANKEIKISITNINPSTGEFNVLIRDFNDSDNDQIILESFVRCSMKKRESSYIGKRIGTYDGEYALRSDYVMVEMSDDFDEGSFPCGFEGYMFNKYGAETPKIFYKTKYEITENINNVFLGISESAYRSRGINQNFFNFNGWHEDVLSRFPSEILEYFEKTKGFHLDMNADENYFEVGEGKFATPGDVLSPESEYENIFKRKFTLVPAGGFDGWNIHRNGRSNGDFYMKGNIFDGVDDNQTPTNDYQAWETAINTFSNPENVYINLFATPGINWLDNTSLVKKSIEMIEKERADSLYVIDSPNENIPLTIGMNKDDVIASRNIAELLNTVNIDSNYSCTYYPWIQIKDEQNSDAHIYIPPTGEVVAAMAFTDKIRFPWFAPAGLQRGVTNAIKSKYRLSNDARKILYSNRINPIADFANTGTAIFGQKTLQMRESALDRINVRRLLLQIKVLISNIAVRLLFEQNDQTTIDQFLSKATPILETIQRERGLYDFQIKMDDTINTPETRDRNELYGEIFLKPTRSVEFIGITFNITPSGASFDDV